MIAPRADDDFDGPRAETGRCQPPPEVGAQERLPDDSSSRFTSFQEKLSGIVDIMEETKEVLKGYVVETNRTIFVRG